MTTKSHYYFGLFLLQYEIHFCTKLEQYAFLFGCVEPDFNVTTYLKRASHGQRLRGHNYPNMLQTVRRLFQKLQNWETERFLFYYRMGKLTHYLTDAFTRPHNLEFSGSLRAHIKYENELENEFLESLSNPYLPDKVLECKELYHYFLEKHQEYRYEMAGRETDIHFTLQVIPDIVKKLVCRSSCFT